MNILKNNFFFFRKWMECNFSQIQNYFKFSKYKGRPTIKIRAPSPSSPTHRSLIIKWYNHSRVLMWKREVSILCTCTKHVSISHHLHSYESLYWSFFANSQESRDKLQNEQALALNSAHTSQPEESSLRTEQQYTSIFCRREGCWQREELLWDILQFLKSLWDSLSSFAKRRMKSQLLRKLYCERQVTRSEEMVT